MKRDLKSANMNFEIVKYVVDDCLTNIKKKKGRSKSAKMANLEYFEIDCKKNCILGKMILKFMNLILGIFEKKLILKHFMHRTITKRCNLWVFWTARTFRRSILHKEGFFLHFDIFLWV